MKKYIEKLKDPRWQRKRLEILNRNYFSCQKCNSKDNTLHIHHCSYSKEIKNPWQYPNRYLKTLCYKCHEDETDMMPSYKDQLLDLCVFFGYISDDYDCLFEALCQAHKIGLKPENIMTLIIRYGNEV